MPPSLSKAAINKLGERLRRSDRVSEEDLRALQGLRAEYNGALVIAANRLRDKGFSPTARLKTTNTIIEKLKREKMRLSKMQDIGGLRLVMDMDLSVQDRHVKAIVKEFPGSSVLDRRKSPNHGYRAVHIIIPVDGFDLEVQVRTLLQDEWAQFYEKLADRLGRGLRYGEPASNAGVAELVRLAQKASDQFRTSEELHQSFRETHREVLTTKEDEISGEIRELEERMQEQREELRLMLAEMDQLLDDYDWSST